MTGSATGGVCKGGDWEVDWDGELLAEESSAHKRDDMSRRRELMVAGGPQDGGQEEKGKGSARAQEQLRPPTWTGTADDDILAHFQIHILIHARPCIGTRTAKLIADEGCRLTHDVQGSRSDKIAYKTHVQRDIATPPTRRPRRIVRRDPTRAPS